MQFTTQQADEALGASGERGVMKVSAVWMMYAAPEGEGRSVGPNLLISQVGIRCSKSSSGSEQGTRKLLGFVRAGAGLRSPFLLVKLGEDSLDVPAVLVEQVDLIAGQGVVLLFDGQPHPNPAGGDAGSGGWRLADELLLGRLRAIYHDAFGELAKELAGPQPGGGGRAESCCGRFTNGSPTACMTFRSP